MNFETSKEILEAQIIEKLKTVFDPEIPVNIYDLGFIYEIIIDDDFRVKLVMTLTAPNCPVAESLPGEVRDAVKTLEGVNDVEIELTFEPPWDMEMISPAGKLELGLL
jgi:FeS assembly SUF system protein